MPNSACHSRPLGGSMEQGDSLKISFEAITCPNPLHGPAMATVPYGGVFHVAAGGSEATVPDPLVG